MESQTAQPPSDLSSAAAYPPWVMFERSVKIEAEGSSSSTSGDATKTSVVARTRTGHLIQVSIRLSEPPAVSYVCVQLPDGHDARHSEVLAAHGDSVLIMIQERPGNTTDYFLYNAGAAAADPPRPPALSLLPPFDLWYHGTGLVRRGEDEVVVAYLHMVSSARSKPARPELLRAAELSLFRAGEWSVKRLDVRFRDASEVRELTSFSDTVVPVGDGLLCWVDLCRLGVVLGDMFEETPKMQYIPLPGANICGQPSNRNVCATAWGDALKFVNIFPGCCCRGYHCKRSRHAYTIETWTMRISNDNDMGWVKDIELWPLDSYKGLRCFPLDHPVMSLDDPNLICFWLHEPSTDGYGNDYENWLEDLLLVNMRSKTIHSVSHHEDELLLMQDRHLNPSKVSYFFNSYRTSRHGALIGPRKKGNERPPPHIVDQQQIRVKRPRASSAEPSVQASEICEAFQDIPSYGLDHDELKVYRILSSDNCRRVRSLLRLPKNLRKEWLLMEIKASEDWSVSTLSVNLSPKSVPMVREVVCEIHGGTEFFSSETTRNP